MNALAARAAAARELVAARELDGPLALSFAVWPTAELEEVSRSHQRTGPRRAFGADVRARALALIAAGMSQRAAAEAVGASRGTVEGWVHSARS